MRPYGFLRNTKMDGNRVKAGEDETSGKQATDILSEESSNLSPDSNKDV